jgi:hypothetical protein
VSPVYYSYTLAFQLESESQKVTIPTSADIRKWLPGDSLFDSTLYVPQDLRPGKYRVRVALLNPIDQKPAINLAVVGRQPDGWYLLGEVSVKSP